MGEFPQCLKGKISLLMTELVLNAERVGTLVFMPRFGELPVRLAHTRVQLDPQLILELFFSGAYLIPFEHPDGYVPVDFLPAAEPPAVFTLPGGKMGLFRLRGRFNTVVNDDPAFSACPHSAAGVGNGISFIGQKREQIFPMVRFENQLAGINGYRMGISRFVQKAPPLYWLQYMWDRFGYAMGYAVDTEAVQSGVFYLITSFAALTAVLASEA